MVKCLVAMQETWVRSLGQEDPLEKEMATYSSTLAWKIPWTDGRNHAAYQAIIIGAEGCNELDKQTLIT